MRIEKRIAIRLAHLQGQRLTGDPLAMGENEYWESILTDVDRRIYYDLAKEAIRMVREETL